MLGLWAAALFFVAGVSLYSSRVARNEEDQIFLTDSSSHARSEQDAIAVRMGRIQPLKRTALILAGAMTAVVLGYYILDMFRQFK
jgi:hypothetical protein